MKRAFSRRELYDLVWSQPMRTVAAELGISDVGLAKHCKKADIPVPSRGYWARKQAGKPTLQIALPPRFPGASDRFGGEGRNHYWGGDWAEAYRDIPIPPIPTFDEEISSVTERVRKLVGKIKRPRDFEPAHPLVAKLLEHDEERRKDYARYPSPWNAPKYDSGIGRRRLLILNAIFLAAARLGCRPSMSTSKYRQDSSDERDISIHIGSVHVTFNVEPLKKSRKEKESTKEVLAFALGSSRNREAATEVWQDDENGPLEGKLTEILIELLVTAETTYRESLFRHRDWIIERKAEAEKEIEKRRQEAERKAREREAKLARERIQRLLSQARSLNRATRIRSYVEGVLARASELSIPPEQVTQWAEWARTEADRIDPIKNGTIAVAVAELPMD